MSSPINENVETMESQIVTMEYKANLECFFYFLLLISQDNI